MEQQDKAAPRDEDVVEDLVLSSDEDEEPLSDSSAESDGNEDMEPVRKQTRKPKARSQGSKKKNRSPANKAKKRKTSRQKGVGRDGTYHLQELDERNR